MVVQLYIQISKINAATELMWGGRLCKNVSRSSRQNTTVKGLLKPVHILPKLSQNTA